MNKELAKILRGYEKKGYIVDEAFIDEYSKEIKKKLRGKKK